MVRNWQNADWICTRIFRKCGDDQILNISGTRPGADLRMNSMRRVIFFRRSPYMLWIVRTVGSTIGGLMKSYPGTNLWGTSGSYMATETSTCHHASASEGHFGTGRSVRLSVPRRSCLGYRHAGCLQLSHRRPLEMRGLRTRPRTDVYPPRFLPPSNCHRR